MNAYYNEFDPYAAQWLKNLIAAGHIAAGEVDSRSITEVTPDDLREFTQCHFFAGIGVWSHALRLSGWDDSRPVWTGSCPCQPFSAAGKGAGTADERHLWPVWFNLIRKCRPDVVFGEQVEAAINHGWLDLVQDDLEGEDYAFAPVGLPAASVGAPHIRARLWFVANNNNNNKGLEGWKPMRQRVIELPSWSDGVVSAMDNPISIGWDARRNDDTQHDGQQLESKSKSSELADTELPYETRLGFERIPLESKQETRLSCDFSYWSDAIFIECSDGKARPTQPGLFPLAHGTTSRVGRLRAYGNAIVAPLASEVIKAYMECRP